MKVTIAISKKSVEFFKAKAAKHRTQYERMIGELVEDHVDNYAGADDKR